VATADASKGIGGRWAGEKGNDDDEEAEDIGRPGISGKWGY